MKLRIMSLLLVMLLLLTAFPLNAFAAKKEYKITVGGTAVTSDNAKDVLGDGTVSFDEKTYTLTLKGAKFDAALADGDYYGIKSNETAGITISVKEKSLIKCKENYKADLCGIFAQGDLTVTGGELYVICENSNKAYGIVCGGNLLFKGATAEIDCVHATDEGVGVVAEKSLAFDDSAARIFGSSAAFAAKGGLSILSGTYYMGNNAPSEKYPNGYQYLISFKIKYYTVTWKNYDGKVLLVKKNVREDKIPPYSGKTPKRPADKDFTYTFRDWYRQVFDDTDEIVYTAVFRREPINKPSEIEQEEKLTEQLLFTTDTDVNDVDYSGFLPLKLRAVGKKKKIILKWKKYKNADGYIIYGAKCGKKLKKIKTVKKPDKTSYTVKKLKKGKYYRYIVIAYKNTAKGRTVTSISKAVHCVTAGGTRGNPRGIKNVPKTLTVKAGASKKLKPRIIKKKPVDLHTPKFRYESTNPAVATVTKKGKIKAKKKGKANIYVYAQNGKYKKIKVTVK